MCQKTLRIGFMGLGKSNLSLMSLMPRECRMTLRDDRLIDRDSLPKGLNIERIMESSQARRDIDEDILFFSPSVRRDAPEFLDAFARGVKFSSDAEIFFEKNARPVFAVTGSDGKSTSATLINMILRAGGMNSRLVGNIGEPMTTYLKTDADAFVCELSSFMLSYLTPVSRRACITNITRNHLDWHSSFEEYREAKLNILKNTDEAILSDEFTSAYGIVSYGKDLRELIRTHKAEIYLTVDNGYILKNGRRIVEIDTIRRKESYNIKNLMTAIAMTDGYVFDDAVREVAESFSGLEHRCESFLTRDGIEYINSSIDTSPARTKATLRALNRPVVIILGGRSKGAGYEEIIEELKKYASYAFITGENADEIYESIKGQVKCEKSNSLEDAIKYGIKLAKGVGTLLFSPASTSYDRFKNFEERGRFFKEITSKCK